MTEYGRQKLRALKIHQAEIKRILDQQNFTILESKDEGDFWSFYISNLELLDVKVLLQRHGLI